MEVVVLRLRVLTKRAGSCCRTIPHGLQNWLKTLLNGRQPDNPLIGNRFDIVKNLNGKKIALQILTQDYSIETMPQWVSLGSTCSCNLQCPHCCTHGTRELHNRSNKNSWSTDMLKRVAKEILPTALSVSLTVNGEPLMTRDFAEVIEEFQVYGALLDVPTNGTLLSNRNIAALIKSATYLPVSIDGATEPTFEAIRKGAKFRNVMNNVRVLTLASERSGRVRPMAIVIAYTLMGSNIRDLPEIVRLAKLLGISHIRFFPLVVFFDHVRNEVLDMHKAAYNYFRQAAEDEAARLGVTIDGLLPPFPDSLASAEAFTVLPDMIIDSLREDYYQNLPPLESFLDLQRIEARVDEVLALIEKSEAAAKGRTELLDYELDCEGIEADRVLVERLDNLLNTEGVLAHGDYFYCQYVHNRTYVSLEGAVSPCCVGSVPLMGNVTNGTIREIWNGDQYIKFRRSFYSSDPPGCCKDCRNRIRLSPLEFIGQLMATQV